MKAMMESTKLQFSGLAIESRVFMIIGLTGIVLSLISVAVSLSLDLGLIPVWSSVLSGLFITLFIYRVYKTERYSFYSTIVLCFDTRGLPRFLDYDRWQPGYNTLLFSL